MAISPDIRSNVVPGSTLRRYLLAADYYKSHPEMDLDNPPPFMRDLGINPPAMVVPNLTSYQQLNDPEYTTNERDLFQSHRSSSSLWIQHNLDHLSLENAARMLPRMDEMVDFLSIRALNEVNQDQSDNQTHEQRSSYELVRTATEFYLIDLMRKMQSLYQDPNNAEVKETFGFLKFYMGTGLLIPFGKNSFIEAFGKNERQISGVESMELLALPLLLGMTGLDVTYFPDHGPDYSRQYPAESRFGIHDMILSILYSIDQVGNRSFKITPKNRNDRILASTINRFIDDIGRKQETIKKTLTIHQKTDHLPTVELFNLLLDRNDTLLDTFMGICGITYQADEIALYRKLVACGETNDSPFCTDTALKFEQVAANHPELFRSLTLEEVKSFYEPNKAVIEDEVASMSDLKQAASDLRFEKKLSRSFELDPSLVEEDGFSPPNILYFTFNMIDSRIFGIRLGYKDSESQDDQIKYLDVHFNTNKGTVDWSILNHPDSQNQDVKTLRQNLMNLARKLLTEVRPMTKQPVQQSESDLTESAPKAKRQRYEDNIYTLRAEAKKGSNGSEQSTGLDKKPSMVYSNTGKRTPIELPDSETWANLIANYSPQNADVIMERITRFNTLGIGDFTSIASGELRNKFDARLRINVAKDTARVMLRLCQSESGSKYYQIVDIRRRGQAYR